ncbi:MAG: hypothetical protein Q9191_000475 [Dirinaria sp. TL-2023a]
MQSNRQRGTENSNEIELLDASTPSCHRQGGGDRPETKRALESELDHRDAEAETQAAPAESEKHVQDQIGQQAPDPEPPFSIFSARESNFIVAIASLAALFSPLTANIYYPALNTLSTDLHVSLSKINLTITTYLVRRSKTTLIFQGLAPSFVGSFSDEAGRRPSYMICFIVYIGANIGLAELKNYPSLLIVRMIQSSGSSGTVALAQAVVADIVTSAERGTSMGYAQMGAMVGPAFGPIVGGLLNQFLGWRSIFWFLTIFSGVVFLIILVSLPETGRKIVGNGSIPPRKWNMSLMSYLHLRKQPNTGAEDQQKSKSGFKARPNPLKSVYIITQKESGLILFYAGAVFSGFYMALSSMPALFAEKYGFNTLQIGLCYIPTGLGSMLASVLVGRFLNWNFRRHARRLGMEVVDRKQQDLTNFPIEAARLQVVLPLMYGAAVTVISYGWVMMSHTSLAGPLVFLFLSTFCMTGCSTGLNALIVDLNLRSPGAASAAMNVARCWMGAGAVAFVNPLLKAIGLGWTSVLVAAVWVCMSPIVLVVIKRGPQWRREKRLKDEKKQQEKENARRTATGNEEGASRRISKNP